MTWSRKGNALHVKSLKPFKDRVLPVLVDSKDNMTLFKHRVSLMKQNRSNYIFTAEFVSDSFQFKQLGFKSIRRKQGDEYFYNNDISNRSMHKLFKKYADKPRESKESVKDRVLRKMAVLLDFNLRDRSSMKKKSSDDIVKKARVPKELKAPVV